ncbi:protein of unknown function [Formosa sp. Hel1_31_208]|uniref:DUF4251 domain-containing protein n=1 Tax=Formosa sp. Hel1_31_208 TaxID=1798225 RepID=UPI0008798E75|nr:DUF4251 domain-containing protein [Formosa sp. Hel1_31_208]SDS33811.1 protein of unknown function [Formosa sp. Hel1_31_208]
MKKIILLCVSCVFVISCSATKTTASLEQIKTLDELVAHQNFSIESDYALPLVTNSLSALQNSGILAPGENIGRISLLNNANELVLKGSQISSKLPYFGEIQQSTGYNGSNNSIVLAGEIKDYRVNKHKDGSYTLKFDAKSKGENFDVIIILYPNLSSEMTLKGAKRFPIRYTGYVRVPKDDTNDVESIKK